MYNQTSYLCSCRDCLVDDIVVLFIVINYFYAVEVLTSSEIQGPYFKLSTDIEVSLIKSVVIHIHIILTSGLCLP